MDVSDPSAPTRKSFAKTGTGALNGREYIQVEGNLAYVAGGNGLAVCDVASFEGFSSIN